jgi:hypothetical protein
VEKNIWTEERWNVDRVGKSHKEELHEDNEMAGHVARMGEKRNVNRLLVRKPEGKRPLGRRRCRWIDNIKMDLSEIGLSVVDWIGLAQERYR